MLDATSGWVALDAVDAWDGTSSWELAVGAPRSEHDLSPTVWGRCCAGTASTSSAGKPWRRSSPAGTTRSPRHPYVM